jgi:FkbM family methyltransferase
VFSHFGAFFESTRAYRRKFGMFRGLRLGWQLRSDYALPVGTPYRVDMPSLRHPIYLRAGTTDYVVFRQILIAEELGFTMPSIPGFVIDAGANIGLTAAYLANRFPCAQIVALEVEKSNFDLLLRNTRMYPRITARHEGLWGHRTKLRIQNPDAGHYAFAVVEADASPAVGETIGALSVSDLLEEYGQAEIGLLKIDVEGSEIEICESGGEQWIEHVAVLVVEIHEHLRPGCIDAVDRLLRNRQFSREKHGEYTIAVRGR